MKLTAIVLAAGASQRMGNDNKLLLDWKGKPLVRHTIDTLTASAVDHIIVVLGHQAEALAEALPPCVTTTTNQNWPQGMGTSIAAGARILSSDNDAVMIHLSDQPLLTKTDVRHLVQQFAKALLADPKAVGVPFFDGRKGNPVFFSHAWRPQMLEASGDVGLKSLVEANKRHLVRLAARNNHIHRDMDTPEAYQALKQV